MSSKNFELASFMPPEPPDQMWEAGMQNHEGMSPVSQAARADLEQMANKKFCFSSKAKEEKKAASEALREASLSEIRIKKQILMGGMEAIQTEIVERLNDRLDHAKSQAAHRVAISTMANLEIAAMRNYNTKDRLLKIHDQRRDEILSLNEAGLMANDVTNRLFEASEKLTNKLLEANDNLTEMFFSGMQHLAVTRNRNFGKH
jgi:hypothetical protein